MYKEDIPRVLISSDELPVKEESQAKGLISLSLNEGAFQSAHGKTSVCNDTAHY